MLSLVIPDSKQQAPHPTCEYDTPEGSKQISRIHLYLFVSIMNNRVLGRFFTNPGRIQFYSTPVSHAIGQFIQIKKKGIISFRSIALILPILNPLVGWFMEPA
jgi:hypothetical protein